jgi:hypothetical protein
MEVQVIDNHKNRTQEISFWFFSILLFLVIFSTNNRILNWMNLGQTISIFGNNISTISALIAPIRGVLFLITLAAFILPLAQDIQKGYQQLVHPPAWAAIGAFLAITLLIVPQGLQGLGQEYGSQSTLIFEKANSVASYQRFLMPALGYITFLRGPIFFFLFSLGCTFGLIYLTHVWLVNNKVHLPEWGFISILTSSFIAAQFQIPGYPDALVFIFLLLIVTFPLSDISKLILIVFSISAHEASIIFYGLFAYFLFDRRSLVNLYGILAVYGLLWAGSEGFSLPALIYHRPQPSATVNMTSFQWLLSNPGREVLGIFFAYKLLWLIILGAIILVIYNKKEHKLAGQIVILLATSILMTFLAVDTSRLIGWSFYALLLSIKVIYDEKKPLYLKIVRTILFINLFIPSAYVGLNLGMLLPPGIYSQFRYIKTWITSLL